MTNYMRYGIVAARVFIATIFLLNGFGVIDQSGAIREMIDRGIPVSAAPVLEMMGRIVEVMAGCGLVLGIYPRLASLALIAFLVPATLIGHAFWLAEGTKMFVPQFLNFLKNLSGVGGLILVAVTPVQPGIQLQGRKIGK